MTDQPHADLVLSPELQQMIADVASRFSSSLVIASVLNAVITRLVQRAIAEERARLEKGRNNR